MESLKSLRPSVCDEPSTVGTIKGTHSLPRRATLPRSSLHPPSRRALFAGLRKMVPVAAVGPGAALDTASPYPHHLDGSQDAPGTPPTLGSVQSSCHMRPRCGSRGIGKDRLSRRFVCRTRKLDLPVTSDLPESCDARCAVSTHWTAHRLISAGSSR